MIKPVIRDISSSDLGEIESWEPKDSTNVDFWLTIMIGVDQHGGDNFDVHVVSPQNLKPGPTSKKYALVLNEYSWDILMTRIDEVLTKCSGFNWPEISEQLSKHFYWEYEGMAPPYL